MKCDFSGWASRNNLKCTDGRTILKDAFKDNDGAIVPLVWNHQHNDPLNVLGHAQLENREDGVYAYCFLNNTEAGKQAKEIIAHRDVDSLSIYANKLQQRGGNVLHGDIKEVSLVLAGANPGAKIENWAIAHSDDPDDVTIIDDEAVIYTGMKLEHSDSDEKNEEKKEENKMPEKKEPEKKEPKKKDNKKIKDVIESMNEEQKKVMYHLVSEVMDDNYDDEDEDEDEGDDETMKHNVFDNDVYERDNVLSHSDQEQILTMAKSSNVGTFQTALKMYVDDNELQHDALSGGFIQTSAGNVTTLFPEYKDVRPGAPELITNDQGWISLVMNKVHKSPISRVRTGQVDIRNIDALRAKGYKKGTEKKLAGNFSLVRRTTDPHTVYVKNALHRDDIIDITDFDYVQYLYNIDRMMLNEELAMAIMLGDGREDGDEAKIAEEHIRPIWKDDELYTIHVDLDIAAAKKELQGTDTASYFGDNFVYAEAMINTVLYARENFKGTGTPDFYCTPRLLNQMLLARDRDGRRIYSSKAELATALNVGSIVTAEQFAGKERTDSKSKKHKLLGLIVNLADYSLGATKGGEVTHFTQFDIDFNQQKSLLETRVSGALTRVYSAIAIEETEATGTAVSGENA